MAKSKFNYVKLGCANGDYSPLRGLEEDRISLFPKRTLKDEELKMLSFALLLRWNW